MSFNDFPAEFREDVYKDYLNPENDYELAAAIFLEAADESTPYPRENGGVEQVLNEVINVLRLEPDVRFVDVSTLEVSFE